MTKQKLLFCPFCQYSGSNDPSYLNHIVCAYYNVNYGCGKCLDEVFITGQQLSNHMKGCKGLVTDEAEKPTSSHMKGAPSSLCSKKKKKHKTKSQLSDSQQDSQTLPPTSSKVSSHMSHAAGNTPRRKLLLSPQKSHTPAARTQGRSIPQATSIPARRTRCTSLTNTRRRRSNVASSPGRWGVYHVSPSLFSAFVDFSS